MDDAQGRDAVSRRAVVAVSGAAFASGFASSKAVAQTASDRGATEAALAEIRDLASRAPDGPSILNKLNKDGSNVDDPESFRRAIGASSAANVDFVPAGEGGVTRSVQSKILHDVRPSPADYGARVDNVSDDSAALQRALDGGRGVFVPPGRMYINSVVDIPPQTTISGADRRTSNIVLGSRGQLRMTGPTYARRTGSLRVANVCISMQDDIRAVTQPGLLLEKVDEAHFDDVVFYHLRIVLDVHRNINFTRCRFEGGIAGAQLNSQSSYQPNGGQGISEYPLFLACFFQGMPVDLVDTVEAAFKGCHHFAGAYGIRSRRLHALGSGNEKFYMGPLVEGCTLDSIDGHAIDIDHGGTGCRITNNFISSGRGLNTAGVRLSNGLGVVVTANEFAWCGNGALLMGAEEGTKVIGNTFHNQAAGPAILLGEGCSRAIIMGNTMRNGPLWGGSGQGATTLAVVTPAGDLADGVVIGNAISGMTDALGLYVEGTNNVVQNNPGVLAARDRQPNSGPTSARPAVAANGSIWLDTTLNKPTWYLGGDWRDASGTPV